MTLRHSSYTFFHSRATRLMALRTAMSSRIVIHDECHDNLSPISIPFCFLAKAEGRTDTASARRKMSEHGDVENCPIIRG